MLTEEGEELMEIVVGSESIAAIVGLVLGDILLARDKIEGILLLPFCPPLLEGLISFCFAVDLVGDFFCFAIGVAVEVGVAAIVAVLGGVVLSFEGEEEESCFSDLFLEN